MLLLLHCGSCCGNSRWLQLKYNKLSENSEWNYQIFNRLNDPNRPSRVRVRVWYKWWWMKLLLQLQLHLQQQQTPKKHRKSGKELQQSSSCGSAPLSSAQLSNELVKFQLFVLLPSLLPPLLLRLVSKSFSGFSQWNFKIYNLHLANASNKSLVEAGEQQVK